MAKLAKIHYTFWETPIGNCLFWLKRHMNQVCTTNRSRGAEVLLILADFCKIRPKMRLPVGGQWVNFPMFIRWSQRIKKMQKTCLAILCWYNTKLTALIFIPVVQFNKNVLCSGLNHVPLASWPNVLPLDHQVLQDWQMLHYINQHGCLWPVSLSVCLSVLFKYVRFLYLCCASQRKRSSKNTILLLMV